MLITDCTYTDEVVPAEDPLGPLLGEPGRRAGPRAPEDLYLVHHDPDHNDDIIDAKLARSRELLAQAGSATSVVAPAERMAFEI